MGKVKNLEFKEIIIDTKNGDTLSKHLSNPSTAEDFRVVGLIPEI